MTKLNKSPTRLLMAKQTAEYLCISEDFLYHCRLCGEGPTWVQLTEKLIRYRLSDVNKWIESNQKA